MSILSKKITDAATSGINAAKGAIGLKGDNELGKDSYLKTDAKSIKLESGKDATWFNDFFLDYVSPDGTNYAKVFGYDFVIYDSATQLAIARIAMPINPTGININVPAAVNLTVTQKGILEEHNGAPLRQISIQGTTGVAPVSLSEVGSAAPGGVASYLFKNTISAAAGVLNKAERAVSAVSGGKTPASGANYTSPDTAAPVSGFKFFHTLARFFDYYLAAKKTKAGASLRLGFNMYKDNMFYFCTLNSYSLRKQAGTLEYFYSIQLTAWKRSKFAIAGAASAASREFKTNRTSSISDIARAVQSIREARKVFAAIPGVLRGFGNDVDQSVFIPIRETILLGKQITGLPLTIVDAFDTASDSVKNAYYIATGKIKADGNPLFGSIEQSANASGFSIASAITAREGQQLSDSAPIEDSGLPVEKALTDTIKSLNTLDQVELSQMDLPPELDEAIEIEKARVLALTAEDWRTRRDKIAKFAQKVSDQLGGGNATYSRIKGQPDTSGNLKQLSVSDILLLQAFNDTIQGLDKMIVSVSDNSTDNTNDYSLFYADFARSYNINFQPAGSKFFVAFPYGASMEQLANQYLGDADRWIEIAAINGLRAPYIDEVGFKVPFIASGAGVTITIQSAANLYIGQVVTLKSKTQKRSVRKIIKIDKVDTTQTLVSFDGEPNLSLYTLADESALHAFLPDTVNSLKMIAIPTDADASDVNKIKLFPGIEDADNLVRLSKVDFLLQSDGDIAMSSGGDIRLAYGMTNLVQAAMMKIFTPQGSIVTKPLFGNPVQVGANTADFSMKDTLKALDGMFKTDTRFSGINAGQATKVGGTVSLNLLLGVDNNNINLPIKTELPTI